MIVLTLGLAGWAYVSIQNDLKHGPLKKAGNLRSVVLASITNPFPQADTFILDTRWIICGNTTPEEIPIIFNTLLDSNIYKNKLADKLHVRVLTIAEFNNVMDTIRKYRFHDEYPPSLWDTCRIGKVTADINAQQLTSTKVRLYEYYQFNNKEKIIQKDFTFKDDEWACSKVDTMPGMISKSE